MVLFIYVFFSFTYEFNIVDCSKDSPGVFDICFDNNNDFIHTSKQGYYSKFKVNSTEISINDLSLYNLSYSINVQKIESTNKIKVSHIIKNDGTTTIDLSLGIYTNLNFHNNNPRINEINQCQSFVAFSNGLYLYFYFPIGLTLSSLYYGQSPDIESNVFANVSEYYLYVNSLAYSWQNHLIKSKHSKTFYMYFSSDEINEIETYPFSASSEFTESSIFSETQSFTSSSTFTSTSPFSKSSTFSISYTFTLSNTFSKSFTFTPSDEFTKTSVFSESVAFTESSEFTPSLVLTPSFEFTPSSTFSQSLFFSYSENYSTTIMFSEIIPLVSRGAGNNKTIYIIIGVCVSAVVVVAVATALIVYSIYRRRKKDLSNNECETQPNSDEDGIFDYGL